MRVLLTGGSGLLGRALLRLRPDIAPDIRLLAPSRDELPLTDRGTVADWIATHRIDAVIHAAAKVGGIQANIDDPTGYLADNLLLNDALIMGAHLAGVQRLVNIGSSCMYPRDYRQPLVEEDILAAPLEPTNAGYALAKITAAHLCTSISGQFQDRAYRTLVPCNLFGPEDGFGRASSHLVAAAITKLIEASSSGADRVVIWGDGRARREFMAVDHLARFILIRLSALAALPPVLNVGTDRDHSVDDYYRMIASIVGWTGEFVHDAAQPVGMQRKLMSSARARALGHQPPAAILPDLEIAVAAAMQVLPKAH